jgi:hypothetical protein
MRWSLDQSVALREEMKFAEKGGEVCEMLHTHRQLHR